jgi:hypothetical protein
VSGLNSDVAERLCDECGIKDFNIEKLLVGNNRTELVNWIDRKMKQSVIFEINFL